ERRQSFSDAPLTTHDACGGSLRRVIHPAGIVFKGSGFYNTDYKNGSSAKRTDTADTATSENGTAKSESGSGTSPSESNSSSSTSVAASTSTPAASTSSAKSDSASSAP